MAPSSCSPLVTQPQSDNRADRARERKRKKMASGREGGRELEKWGIKERRRYGPGRREIRKRESKGGPEHKGKAKKEIERGKRVILAGQGLIYHGQISEGQAGPEDFCPAAISPQPSQVLSGLQLE